MTHGHDRAYARNSSIDFKGIAAAALVGAKSLLQEWLPGGRFEGREYVALNPTRNDRALGSFKINWQTGEWADFADPNAKGRDLISLFAYINRLDQGRAARQIGEKLGIPASRSTPRRSRASLWEAHSTRQARKAGIRSIRAVLRRWSIRSTRI